PVSIACFAKRKNPVSYRRWDGPQVIDLSGRNHITHSPIGSNPQNILLIHKYVTNHSPRDDRLGIISLLKSISLTVEGNRVHENKNNVCCKRQPSFVVLIPPIGNGINYVSAIGEWH